MPSVGWVLFNRSLKKKKKMVLQTHGVTKNGVTRHKMRQKTVIKNVLQSVTGVYYKVRQVLQSVTDCYYKVRQVLQSMTGCYYKVRQV